MRTLDILLIGAGLLVLSKLAKGETTGTSAEEIKKTETILSAIPSAVETKTGLIIPVEKEGITTPEAAAALALTAAIVSQQPAPAGMPITNVYNVPIGTTGYVLGPSGFGGKMYA